MIHLIHSPLGPECILLDDSTHKSTQWNKSILNLIEAEFSYRWKNIDTNPTDLNELIQLNSTKPRLLLCSVNHPCEIPQLYPELFI